MRKTRIALLFATVLLAAALGFRAWSQRSGPRPLSTRDAMAIPAELRALLPLHTPLHTPLAPPGPHDWLAKHVEKGQSYEAFVKESPVRATETRRTLFIVPLGNFTPEQRTIVREAAELLGLYFQLPVKIGEDIPLSVIPQSARRLHQGSEQIRTTHVLNELLKPHLPADAAASIAFTASDLWPGEGWSFVFGEASLRGRVGVWSIHRFGDPSRGEASRRLALRRTLQTAVHETGHMFSLDHCIHFSCAMNGSNHLEEADGQPLWLCPECLAKVSFATGADPRKRFDELSAFARERGFEYEADFWARSKEVVERERHK